MFVFNLYLNQSNKMGKEIPEAIRRESKDVGNGDNICIRWKCDECGSFKLDELDLAAGLHTCSICMDMKIEEEGEKFFGEFMSSMEQHAKNMHQKVNEEHNREDVPTGVTVKGNKVEIH